MWRGKSTIQDDRRLDESVFRRIVKGPFNKRVK